jgi:heat shock protein HslJ
MKYIILTVTFLLSSILLLDAKPRKRKHKARARHRTAVVAKNVKTIWVADHQVDCQGVGPMKCFLIKYAEEEEWQNYYGTIDRFKFVEGFEYKIQVKETPIQNPPADAPDVKWTLARVLSKKEAEIPRLPLASQWILESYYDGNAWVSAGSKSAYITIARDLKSFTGTGGCNRLRGNLDVNANNVKFGQIISTKMACDKLQAETKFINVLESATSFEIKGAELFLYKDGQPIVSLESYR